MTMDVWVVSDDAHRVRLSRTWPSHWPVPPIGISEWSVAATVSPDVDEVAAVDACAYAWARVLRWYGLHTGERPQVDPDPRVLDDGRRRHRVRLLVTRAPDWVPPADGSLFEGDGRG